MNQIDTICVLTGCGPRGNILKDKFYAKARTLHGALVPEYPYFHLANEIALSNVYDLSKQLTKLESDPHSCVIRGELNREVSLPCRRKATNFVDKAHHWVCFDFDSIPGDLSPLQVVCQCLPTEFHNVTFHWQYSGNQGFKPGIRLHVWFWVDKPVNSSDWKRWLNSYGRDDQNQYVLQVDPALYRVVQPHITSNPVLYDVPDPVEFRSGLQKGTNDVAHFVLGPEPTTSGKSYGDGNAAPAPPPENWLDKQKGVIGEFNLNFSVSEVLEWHGYEKVGDRYLHPRSTSMMPDTIINSSTHAYAFGSNNPLFEQGIDRTTGEIKNRNHDAFDVFRILSHDGNEARAVAMAAKLFEGAQGL